MTSDALQLYADVGGGGMWWFFCSHSFLWEWDDSWLQATITVKELYPIMLAVKVWSEKL